MVATVMPQVYCLVAQTTGHTQKLPETSGFHAGCEVCARAFASYYNAGQSAEPEP